MSSAHPRPPDDRISFAQVARAAGVSEQEAWNAFEHGMLTVAEVDPETGAVTFDLAVMPGYELPGR